MRIGALLAAAGLTADVVASRTGLPDVTAIDVRPAPSWMERLWGSRASAMTLGSRVFVARSVLAGDPVVLGRLLVHECCHVRQWRQAGALRFVFRYLTDYLRGRVAGLDHRDSYRAIRYEAEARQLAGG